MQSQKKKKAIKTGQGETSFYSLRFKFGLIFVLFFVLALSNFFAAKYFLGSQKIDGDAVNVAGRNAMLAQGIGFYAEQVFHGNEDVKKILREKISLHQSSFHALVDGGVVLWEDGEIILPSAAKNIRPLLVETEELWHEYRKNGLVVANEPTFVDDGINPAVGKAVVFLEQNSEEMMNRSLQIVDSLTKASNSKHANLNFALLIILALNLLIIVLAGFFIKYFILKPVRLLTATAYDISAGKLSARARIHSRDEIGVLAQSFNDMADGLVELQKLQKEKLTTAEQSKEQAEKLVRERTKKLEEQLVDLERFNKLAVGRELRMIELKQEIAKIKKQDGKK